MDSGLNFACGGAFHIKKLYAYIQRDPEEETGLQQPGPTGSDVLIVHWLFWEYIAESLKTLPHKSS